MSLEVYLEPSQTSTMKFFRENSYRLFPLKSLIVDLRLDSEFASETVILLKKKIKQEELYLIRKLPWNREDMSNLLQFLFLAQYN